MFVQEPTLEIGTLRIQMTAIPGIYVFRGQHSQLIDLIVSYVPLLILSTTVITVPTTATTDAAVLKIMMVKDLIFVKMCKSSHSNFNCTAQGKMNAMNAEPMAPEKDKNENNNYKME